MVKKFIIGIFFLGNVFCGLNSLDVKFVDVNGDLQGEKELFISR